MKTRDRLFLMGIVAAAILVAGYVMFVSPERKQASSLAAQVTQDQQTLSTAQGQAQSAEADKARYPSAYASLVQLGKAVPPSDDVASLVYELDQASNSKDVSFNSITTGASGPADSGATSPSTTTAAAAGFTTLPFTFQFNGTFFDLYNLLNKIDQFAVQDSNGSVNVSGRLLTIQSTSLTTGTGGKLQGNITADAYVLGSGTSATGGASAAGPAGAAPASTSTPATGTPAVVQTTP